MLRAAVIVLALANLLFWAWSVDAFEGLGLAPARERDPARLAQQVRPEAVRVLAPPAVTAALATGPAAAAAPVAVSSSAASAPMQRLVVCLETGPFNAVALDAAERSLAAAALPEGSWTRISAEAPPTYAVVLGPFNSRDALKNKREELAKLRLPIEGLNLLGDGAATNQPGLALGRYDNRDAADKALAGFVQRGVRTARVTALRSGGSDSRLRFENLSPAQIEQLRAAGGAALGSLTPCATAAPGAPSAPSR